MFDPRANVKATEHLELTAGPVTAAFISQLQSLHGPEGAQEAFSKACRVNAHQIAMPESGPYLLTNGAFGFKSVPVEGESPEIKIICPAFNQMGAPTAKSAFLVPSDTQVPPGTSVRPFNWTL